MQSGMNSVARKREHEFTHRVDGFPNGIVSAPVKRSRVCSHWFHGSAILFPIMVPHSILFLQALAAWQWWNYLVKCTPSGKRTLCINLDETSICVHQPSPRGVICISRSKASELSHHVPRSARRRYMTYVCIICDDVAMQPLMPQFLIGNESTLHSRDMSELREGLPRNVYLLRRKSAWNDQRLMVQILRHLRCSILPHLGDVQPIILWDAARQHTTNSVFSSANRFGLWPITIPAKLTWLLQPLDTHVFARFKRGLEETCHAAHVESTSGQVAFLSFMKCVYSTIEWVVLSGSWRDAFEGDGFSHSQRGLSVRVKRDLQLVEPLSVSEDQPTLGELAHCFPKRLRISHGMVFGAVAPPTLRRSRPLSTSAAPVAVRLHPPAHARTRSRARALSFTARFVLTTNMQSRLL